MGAVADTAEEVLHNAREEVKDSAGHVKSWFNSIKKEGFWDRGMKRRRSRRGAPGTGRGVR
ncbi:MAG: hypothetical protein JL50_04850 [Peptococcaceae bacterium BICA1-7]|nr:MAG: hypothetical protein JL50_04850 [Peptococcaceae bacterium BICA1-7]HBV95948.1 hypothetical protein [Desulfotomaculum sp.]